MYILIDNKSGTPIYDQIYTQIKNQILSGELEPDSALPSIRALAKWARAVGKTLGSPERGAVSEAD